MRYVMWMVSFVLCGVSLASADTPSSVPIIGIEQLTYNGNGCPPGSTVVDVSPDGEAFTVIFSTMVAEVAPGADATHQKLKCKLHAKVRVPQGWSYAISSVDFRGFVALEPGVTASEQAKYHMSGESPETTKALTWNGAVEEDFNVRDVGGASPVYWSRCGKGKNLMITTELNISNQARPDASGFMVVDTVDGQVYHLLWKRC
jgi:hypothetical protein